MKTGHSIFRGIQVLIALSISTFAVGCGGGKSSGGGQSGGTYDECTGTAKRPPKKNCENMGGTEAAQLAADNAAQTASILNRLSSLERELGSAAGGVNRPSPLAAQASAATATVASGLALRPLLPADGAASPDLTGGLGGNPQTGLGGDNGGSGSGVPGFGNLGGGGSGEGGTGSGSGTIASASPAGSTAGSGNVAAATATGGRGGGGARAAGGSGGAGKSFAELFGGGSGNEAGGGSRTDSYGPLGVVSPQGTEDPSDYFTRLGIGDNLFKIVERRYRNKAVGWARNEMDSISAKSRMP